jgi:hypothetical protein
MSGPKDPFEAFREKKKLERLNARVKGDSGPLQPPPAAEKKGGDSPLLGKDRSWFY